MFRRPAREPDLLSITGVLHRETVRLVMLMLLVVGAIAATRAIANWSRRLDQKEAAAWFTRGQARIARGDAAAAVTAFRRAALKRRGEKAYTLALADALVRHGNAAGAERTLVVARAAAPEDPDINVALARVAAARQQVALAVRYYHYALYAPRPHPEPARQVRLELIRFLTDQGQTSEAIAELIGAASDTPASSVAHVELAELFARAHDPLHALAQFKRALALDGDSTAARIGAGRAAFALGDYVTARRYLQGVGVEDARQLATTAEFVITRDPLAARLGAKERRRRMDAILARVRQLLEGCLVAAAPEQLPGFTSELAVLAKHKGATARDDDILEATLQLAWHVSTLATARCHDPTPLDRALVIIAQRHGLAQS